MSEGVGGVNLNITDLYNIRGALAGEIMRAQELPGGREVCVYKCMVETYRKVIAKCEAKMPADRTHSFHKKILAEAEVRADL